MNDQNTNKPKIRFRNYTPYDQSLLDRNATETISTIKIQPELSKQTIKDDNHHTAVTTLPNIISLKPEDNPIEKELNEVNNQLANGNNEGADLNIIPKKINWDLKRHIEPRLEKLRKRTQKAIVEILKEKLSKEELLEGEGGASDSDDE